MARIRPRTQDPEATPMPEATAAPAPRPWPSAALVSASIPRGPKLWAYLGEKMGLNPKTRLHVRDQGETFFISTAIDDTILFPVDHPTHARQQRWDWVDDAKPGIQLGTAVVVPDQADELGF